MSLVNPVLLFVGEGFWTVVLLMATALVAGYVGWTGVEYIPFTRQILERREAARRTSGDLD